MKLDELHESHIVGVADMAELLLQKHKPLVFMALMSARQHDEISHGLSSFGRLAFPIHSIKRHHKARAPMSGELVEYVVFRDTGTDREVWIMEHELDNFYKLEPMGHGFQITNV